MAKVTQEQIAQATGISRTTVSAILGGRKTVRSSPETKRRVLEAAQRLGYLGLPHDDAGPRRIGVLITPAVQDILTNEYWLIVYSGLEETFWEHDYHLLVSSRRDKMHQAGAIPKFLRHDRVAGLVILSATVSVPAVAGFGLPMVSLGQYVSDPRVDSIYPDNRRGAALAAEHLLELGHRTFLVLTQDPINRNFGERFDAFAQCIHTAGGEIVGTLTVDPSRPESDAYEQVRDFLGRRGRPFTAVMGLADFMGSGAMAALRDTGIATPDEVSVVGFLDVPSAAKQQPPLTTVRVPMHRMAQMAAYHLLDHIRRPEQPTGLQILMPVELVVRASTGPAARAREAISERATVVRPELMVPGSTAAARL